MPVEPQTQFAPPTPEQFHDLLRDHPANPPTKWQVRAPLLIAVALIIVSFAMADPLSALLPWVALAWLFGHSSIRTRRALTLEYNVRRTQEIAMLRRYPEALRRGWRTLPQTVPAPMLHGQTVAMISHCLDTMGCYDAAIVGYDFLLNNLSPGQPITVHIAVSRAAAVLGAERLSDGDDSIRRLRGPVEPFDNTPIGAAYRLARLTQQVRTHHFADGVDESEGLIEALRPLGVEAGYGHALMALCHYHCTDADSESAGTHQDARTWWEQATLLLPAGSLLHRFPELAPLTELK
jgi:hypothetical protein